MIRPGERNAITDVPGVRVGSAEDTAARSGVTVVLPDRPAVAAVEVRGGAPGTHETDLLAPSCLVDRVDAVVLSGGSAFGLEAAAGVASWLHAQGRGFPVGTALVPIVPAAIVFDLLNGGAKDWGEMPPYRALGQRACTEAGHDVRLGNAGAGLGVKAGAIKGGLGSASALAADGLTVGALVVANPYGTIAIPGTAVPWAAALERAGEFGGPFPAALADDLDYAAASALGANTTIAVVATNATLTKAEAQRVALMAHDGIARAVWPAHTPFDGDTVFAVATGAVPLPRPAAGALCRIGAMAADCLARAIVRGVLTAEDLGDLPSFRTWRARRDGHRS